jgi:hypothetical protein
VAVVNEGGGAIRTRDASLHLSRHVVAQCCPRCCSSATIASSSSASI